MAMDANLVAAYRDAKLAGVPQEDYVGNALNTFNGLVFNLDQQITAQKEAKRAAKKADRRADRDARQEAGLRGSQKREMRRAQRQQRKDAWKTYKDDQALDAIEDAADLEKQINKMRKKDKEDRGPNDLTRLIDELEKENGMLKDKIKRLQAIMMEQYRNKGAL